MRRAQFLMAWLVAVASAALPAAPLAAEVVVYDNSDGTFVWSAALVFPFRTEATHLDITLPPTQSGEITANSVELVVEQGVGPYPHLTSRYESDNLASIAVPPYPRRVSFIDDCAPATYFPVPAATFAPTELIGPGQSWLDKGVFLQGGVSLLSGPYTIGVRIVIDGQYHYGWIRSGATAWAGASAWAYETEPDVPIAAWGEPDADDVLNVPTEYPSIRNALHHALPGQHVVVADGIYGTHNRLLDLRGKAITVRSANGPATCILQGSTDYPNCDTILLRFFEFLSGEGPDSVIEGFTFRLGATGGHTGPGGIHPGGGAIVCDDGSSPTIRNCVFEDNLSLHEGVGGALAVFDGSPAIRDCVFRHNRAWAQVSTGTGGAAYLSSSGAQFINCLFVGNESETGAAIGGTQSDAEFIGCTIVGNISDSPFGQQYGAIAGDVGSLTNCVVFDNAEASFAAGAVAQVTYSCVEGGWPGVGNISSDPQFVDPSADDYHLAATSPCIDAASNPAVPRGVTEDLDGNPRFQDDPATTDTGLGRAPIVDMGAYEFQVPFDPADLNVDGDVDGFDLALLLGQWTGAATYSPCPPHAPADLNSDCQINGFDLALLLGAWGP